VDDVRMCVYFDVRVLVRRSEACPLAGNCTFAGTG
jgi:hypothetical protein